MTIKLRARVYHDPCPDASVCTTPRCSATSWTAIATANDEHDEERGAVIQWCESWPEAMRAAYKLLADLDVELMAEVHESRATRRTERCGGCRDLGPHRNTPDCQYYTPEAP